MPSCKFLLTFHQRLSSSSLGWLCVSEIMLVDFDKFLLSFWLTSISYSPSSTLCSSSCILLIASRLIFSYCSCPFAALLSLASYLYTISLSDFAIYCLFISSESSSDETFRLSPGFDREPLCELLKNDALNSFAFLSAYSSALMFIMILYWSISISGTVMLRMKLISSSALSA